MYARLNAMVVVEDKMQDLDDELEGETCIVEGDPLALDLFGDHATYLVTARKATDLYLLNNKYF